MKTQEQLINNVIGQLKGVNRMINSEKECFSVLVQIKAAKSAVNNLMNKYIEENVINCIKTCNKEKGEENTKQEREEMLKKLLIEVTKNN